MSSVPLTITDPIATVPTKVAVATAADGAELAYVATPGLRTAVFILAADKRSRMWLANGTDAPRMPAKFVAYREAVDTVLRVRAQATPPGPNALRGQWKGSLLVKDGETFVIVLGRQITTYGLLLVYTREDAQGWWWHYEGKMTWFQPDQAKSEPQGPFSFLAEAIEAGVAGASSGPVARACSTRDTTRRGAVDPTAPPVRPPTPVKRDPTTRIVKVLEKQATPEDERRLERQRAAREAIERGASPAAVVAPKKAAEAPKKAAEAPTQAPKTQAPKTQAPKTKGLPKGTKKFTSYAASHTSYADAATAAAEAGYTLGYVGVGGDLEQGEFLKVVKERGVDGAFLVPPAPLTHVRFQLADDSWTDGWGRPQTAPGDIRDEKRGEAPHIFNAGEANVMALSASGEFEPINPAEAMLIWPWSLHVRQPKRRSAAAPAPAAPAVPEPNAALDAALERTLFAAVQQVMQQQGAAGV